MLSLGHKALVKVAGLNFIRHTPRLAPVIFRQQTGWHQSLPVPQSTRDLAQDTLEAGTCFLFNDPLGNCYGHGCHLLCELAEVWEGSWV